MEKRNLDLAVRNENTREKFHTEVTRFELDQIVQHFTESIEAINKQFAVADELIKAGKTNDWENIWRSHIIFLASAFDFYMHELTKYGLCEIYDVNWEETEKYLNLQVSMKEVKTVLESGNDIDWFLEYINGYYETITMVSYESVRDQLNLLGIELKNVADGAFHKRGETEKTKDKLKRRLNELFRRRNIIAHQSDRTHANAQIKDITKETVQEFIQDVQKIVDAITDQARQKGNV